MSIRSLTSWTKWDNDYIGVLRAQGTLILRVCVMSCDGRQAFISQPMRYKALKHKDYKLNNIIQLKNEILSALQNCGTYTINKTWDSYGGYPIIHLYKNLQPNIKTEIATIHIKSKNHTADIMKYMFNKFEG
eukprot:398169_1